VFVNDWSPLPNHEILSNDFAFTLLGFHVSTLVKG
jgi:hypothetical protein